MTTTKGPSRTTGLALAGATAVISGVSVFANGFGVHAIASPAVYTTAKNLVAGLLLALGFFAVPALRARTAREADAPRPRPHGRLATFVALSYVGVVGGGVAFILFFNGLARSDAESSAFLHDTLVIWVAALALPLLGERVGVLNVVAVGALLVGQTIVAGGIGHLVVGEGALLVLGATLLWALEVVVARRLLRERMAPGSLALVRMGVGSSTLLAYLAVTGRLHALLSLDARALGWALLTGALLAGYVATWLSALERARAVDVTSILAASVVVTSLCQALDHESVPLPHALGLALVLAGAAAIAAGGRHVRVRRARS